jgi:hypothetical protein
VMEWDEEHSASPGSESGAKPHHVPCEGMGAEQARPRPAPAATLTQCESQRGAGVGG